MADVLNRREVDALLRAAAQPKRNGRLVTYNPGARIVAPRGNDGVASSAFDAVPSRAKSSSGHGGLGSILNNPVAKGITEALGVLDVPRRAVISAVKEVNDYGEGKGFSGSDFLDQVGDKSFGFGDIAPHTGNKWVDRGIGFAGDVLLDPLTYVTFGAGKFAGQAGRVAAAEKLAEAGLDATKVGRLGIMGANAVEREAIFQGLKDADKLAQPGLRFLGARIPGTGALAETVGGGLAKTRAAITDHVPEVLRGLRSPKGLEDAYRALADGRGATDALEVISAARTRAGERGLFSSRYTNDADRVAREAIKAGDAADHAAFTELDEGLTHGPVAAQGRALLDAVKEDAGQSIKTLGEGRADYAPHIWTQEARDALRGDKFATVRQEVGLDLTEATGGAVKRTIHPGSKLTMPDGSVVEFVADTAHGAVSARQINEKLGKALGVDKVIEDRLSRTLQPYIEGIAESVGRAKADAQAGHLAGRGGMVDAVDKEATKRAAKKEVKSIEKAIRDEGKVDAKIVRRLNESGAATQKAVVDTLRKDLETAVKELDAAKLAEKAADRAKPGIEAQRRLVTKQAEADVSAAQKKLDALAVEQAKLHEDTVAQRAEIDAAKRRAHLERDAGRKRDLRAGVENPRGGPIPETAAAKEAHAALDKHVAQAQASIDARRDGILGKMDTAERQAQKQYDDLDAARAAVAQHKMDARTEQVSSKRAVEKAKERLKAAERLNVKPTKASAAAYAKVRNELDELAKLTDHSPAVRETRALLVDYGEKVAELRDGAAMNKALNEMAKAVKSGDIKPVLKKVIQDGYEQIGTSLLGDEAPIIRNELARQLKNLDDAFEDPGFWRVIDKYTQYFKTYATATVGFHVRNGMTAAFMNATDGVSVRNMLRGPKLWEAYVRSPREFLDNLPEWITREQAENALRAVFASGGGSGQFGKAEVRIGGSKLTNNPFTRASTRVGGRVEGFARMSMAVDTVLAGGSWEEAAARISRIHFNYSEVSKFDAKMKRIIPFWTFLSRNVPMQVQQMFLKPRLYQQYASLARNFGQDYENGMIPLSWQEAGAFQITDGVYLAPDLSHLRLESDLAKLTTDPQRLLADANPLLKVPFETLVAKRKLFNDQPFREGGVESVSGGGLSLLEPALKALGLTDTAGDGTEVVDEKLGYALRGLNPLLSQYQRLFGNDPYYSDKRGQSVLNQGGIPVKLLTKGQRDAEQARRQRAAKKKDPKMAALQAFSNG